MKRVGLFFIVMIVGLMGVPTALYEAASMDGAKGWAKIRYITIPMIQPIIFFIFSLII